SIASARRFASKASNSSSKALILSRSASNGFSRCHSVAFFVINKKGLPVGEAFLFVFAFFIT
ncbi:hypothetical protein, partial [Listeria monocytogenes]|uniref:hypothetical protein n=1 Tax=Listeria monocytogenes TaxID=1639 RepID=UPI001C0D435D